MTQTLTTTLPLERWAGERGTYHLVSIIGEAAEQIATHAALHRMEFGKQRGFGSVKCYAKTGTTRWKTSVFPVKVDEGAANLGKSTKNWILLISKKVMRAEDLAEGDTVELELELL